MSSTIGVCGHFASGHECYDGQTIKTRIFYDELISQLDSKKIFSLDTYKWKKNKMKILLETLKLAKNSDNIIIILSNKGRKIFIPLFLLLKRIFKNKLYCIVIGGNFTNELKQDKIYRIINQKLDGIFVETTSMLKDLEQMDFNNGYLLHNFKKLNILSVNEIKKNQHKPYKLCTFSRVCLEKGIEDIISAIIDLNNESNAILFTLDIYGQIQEDYKERFFKIVGDSPEYIQYKGLVQYNKSVEVLKEYYMLVFPTYFEGEGFPGTVIDAYSAGVPILASDWKHNCEFIKHEVHGLVYKTRDILDLKKTLSYAYKNEEKITTMRVNCLETAYLYNAPNVITMFIEKINNINSSKKD